MDTSNGMNCCTDTSSYRNSGMGDRFFLDSYNRKKDRTPGPKSYQDNRRACIHCQKPS